MPMRLKIIKTNTNFYFNHLSIITKSCVSKNDIILLLLKQSLVSLWFGNKSSD